MKLKIKHSYLKTIEKYSDIFIIFLFIFTTLLYLNINKLPLTHPGNIKAADPTYHVLGTENVIDTQQANYYPYYVALGQEKALNYIPALFSINSAKFSVIAGVPAWVSLYSLVALSQALFVIVVYLITKEIFGTKIIGLVSSIFAVLPNPVSVWLYGLFIGFWVQVPAFLFVISFFWLFIKYIKSKSNWILFFMGVCITSVTYIHTADLMLMFLPSLVVLAIIFWDYIKNKVFIELIKKGLIFGLLPLIAVISYIPRFLYVWNQGIQGWYSVGLYGISKEILTQNVVYPSFTYFPKYILVLYVVGFLLLLINTFLPYGLPKIKGKKLVFSKDTIHQKIFGSWIFISVFFFIMLFLSRLLFIGPVYLEKARAMQPVFVYPTVSYVIYLAISVISFAVLSITNISKKHTKLVQLVIVLLLGIVVLNSNYRDYSDLVNNVQYEHVSLPEWKAYKWIHENTAKDATVFFFGGVFQAESLYAKRVQGLIGMPEYQRLVNVVVNENRTPTTFEGVYTGSTLRATRVYEKSLFEYEQYEELPSPLELEDFNYVFFQDLNPEFAQVNRFFASEFITKHGFIPVYDQEGYLIIKNAK